MRVLDVPRTGLHVLIAYFTIVLVWCTGVAAPIMTCMYGSLLGLFVSEETFTLGSRYFVVGPHQFTTELWCTPIPMMIGAIPLLAAGSAVAWRFWTGTFCVLVIGTALMMMNMIASVMVLRYTGAAWDLCHLPGTVLLYTTLFCGLCSRVHRASVKRLRPVWLLTTCVTPD